ncbi:MAG: EamA family transporter [archaeon]
MTLPAGIIFAIISMIGYGLSNAIAKVPNQEIGNKKTIFYRGLFISTILLIILLSFLKEANFSLNFILITFGIAFVGYLPLLTFYKSLEVGKVGIVSPIANSSIFFTVILSIIFFGERLFLMQGISIIIILLGIILMSINFKEFKSSHLFQMSSGVPYALITCILWGLVFFLFKIPVNVLGPILTSFLIEFEILIYSGVHNLFTNKFKKGTFAIKNKKMILYTFLVALFGGAGTLFFNMGIQNYNVSIIAAIAFANPLIATLYGKIVYKEKLKLQQYFALAIIIAGIVSISYY